MATERGTVSSQCVRSHYQPCASRGEEKRKSASGMAAKVGSNSTIGRHFCAVAALLLIVACVHRPLDPMIEIHDAVKTHDLGRVRQLVEADAMLLEARDSKGNLPLHWAAFLGHRDITLYLIESGSDVNARNWSEEIPLHAAAQSPFDDVAMVVFLLRQGADIDANSGLSTPFLAAASEGNTRVEEYLLAEGADPSPDGIDNIETGTDQAQSGVELRDEDDRPIEEITVYGTRPKNFRIPIMTIMDIYEDRRKGSYFYRIGKLKEAFPYLLNAARHGFKYAQARVGYLYLTGRGDVPQDNETAIGWLGVAASATTMPEISRYWNNVREQIPEELMPHAEEVVSSYIARYGADANRVNCRRSRSTRSHIKTLSCYFDDEFRYSGALDALSARSFTPVAIGSGPN